MLREETIGCMKRKRWIQMEKIKFVPLTYGSDTKTYVRADTIVELSEDGDKTSVYISNSDVPIKVKESIGEILAKIRETAWEQVLTDRIEPDKVGKWIDTGEISTNRRGQIVHEVICSECNGISYFRSMGNKYIGANLCPNCGSRNEVEYDNR